VGRTYIPLGCAPVMCMLFVYVQSWTGHGVYHWLLTVACGAITGPIHIARCLGCIPKENGRTGAVDGYPEVMAQARPCALNLPAGGTLRRRGFVIDPALHHGVCHMKHGAPLPQKIKRSRLAFDERKSVHCGAWSPKSWKVWAVLFIIGC
jgi:hypothetical protein